MARRTEERERGLPSINESRRRRRRAIVLGRVQVREAAPQFWLWVFAVLAAFGVIYWRYAEGQLLNQKGAVMAKQRAIASVLGPKIHPFTERVERWTRELGGQWSTDQVASGIDLEQFTHASGAYLRLLIEDAQSNDALTKAAAKSVRDGFTACLFAQDKAVSPTQGEPCKAISDCPAGKLCNDYSVCTPPGEPFNLRLGYRALRILTSKWSDELHAARNDLEVRTFELDLDKAAEHDVPLAIELLTRSKYFTVLLDEPPNKAEDGSPAEAANADETPAEHRQRVAHPVRIGVWDLQTDQPVLKLRTEAVGSVVAVGDKQVTDPRIVAAQQRQVNNCALALTVKEKLSAATPKSVQ
ncbi:MAG TPA: hypothetical protein VHO25_09745 [Polyangiaceae bacterium]|nr:hypothetical protein [Polyangiaceae bacterium]